MASVNAEPMEVDDAKPSVTSSYADKVVGPGDTVLDLTKLGNQTLRLGGGLRQVRQTLTLRDRLSTLLTRMRRDITGDEWAHMAVVGLGGLRRYCRVARDVSLMVALIERWDHTTNTFHLPIGELTVTVEDVYRILRLPIHGAELYACSREEHDIHMVTLFGEHAVEATYHSASFAYEPIYAADEDEHRLAILMMIDITVYALPDAEGGRFSIVMTGVLVDMIEEHTVFAWAPVFLAQLYRELWGISRRWRYSLCVGHLLHYWAYEHIVVTRPLGLIVAIQAGFRVGFRRWREVMAQTRVDDVVQDIDYYRGF